MTYRYFLAGLLLASGCGEPISGEGGYAGDDEPYELLPGGVLAGDQVIDWSSDPCSGSVSATGNRLGQVAEDFSLMDQFGRELNLHDFCDRTVLLVSSAEWCIPCREEAPMLADWYNTYKDEGLMVITLITENADNAPAPQDMLWAWADAFDIEHPVVSDVDWEVTRRFVDGKNISIPTMHLLRRGLYVDIRDGEVHEDDIQRILSEGG